MNALELIVTKEINATTFLMPWKKPGKPAVPPFNTNNQSFITARPFNTISH